MKDNNIVVMYIKVEPPPQMPLPQGNPIAEAMRKRYGGSVHKHPNKVLDARKGRSRRVKHKGRRGW